jgi:hypothetical protein
MRPFFRGSFYPMLRLCVALAVATLTVGFVVTFILCLDRFSPCRQRAIREPDRLKG